MPLNEPGAAVCPVPVRRGVLRAATAMAAVALLAGCAAGGADNAGGAAEANSGERFVGGDGSSTSFAPEERKDAPAIEGKDLDGEEISLEDFKGDVVVVNFWGSWCVPCREEAPVLEEVYGEHRDDGMQFLGINIRDNTVAAQAFERKQKVSYPSIEDKKGTVAQAFRDTVPPSAIPSTLVIDREGRIAARIIGATNYNGLTKLVTPVLKEGEADRNDTEDNEDGAAKDKGS